MNPLPFWAEQPPKGPTPWSGSDLTADVVVVGAGMAGLSAALHLLRSRPARQVLVLEGQRVGYGASTRTTGMLTPGVGQNLAALVKRHGEEVARRMYQITLDAVRYPAELLHSEGVDAEVRLGGQLVVAQGPSGPSRVEQTAALMERLQLPCDRLTGRQLLQRLSLPGFQDLQSLPLAALHYPTAGTLNPAKLLRGLTEAVLRRGGRVMEGAVVTEVGRGRPARLRLAGGGTVIADQVVLATNGYSGSLGFQRGRILPVQLRVLLTRPLDRLRLHRFGWVRREGVIDSRRLFSYFRLTEDDRVLFGGGRPFYRWKGAEESTATTRVPQALLREFVQVFGADCAESIDRCWAGTIGYVLDGLPIIERSPTHPAVVTVGGWCGHGVALSLSSGRWITDLVDRGRPAERLPWFRTQGPLLPSEPVRWMGIPLAGNVMGLLDRF